MTKAKITMIEEIMEQIESKPALQVKRLLISYFVESVHNGWDGFTKAQVDGINAFINDFLIALNEVEQPVEPFVAFGVTINSEE